DQVTGLTRRQRIRRGIELFILPVIGTGVRHHAASDENPQQHKRKHQGCGKIAAAPPYRPPRRRVSPLNSPRSATVRAACLGAHGYFPPVESLGELYGRRGAANVEKGN